MLKAQWSEERTGILAALGAFLIWGFSPIYYRAAGLAPALEIVAHRAIWSLVFTLLLLWWSGKLKELTGMVKHPRVLGTLFISSLLVSFNWLTFIWAVNNDKALEASMGYFLFPIVMVLLGRVFLKERLTGYQVIAVFLVSLGVLNLLLGYARFPWVALMLAASMGFYSLVRKTVVVNALTGLTIECLLLGPFAAGYLMLLAGRGALVFGSTTLTFDVLLICSALMTALPLILFTRATRILRLGTVGLLQYINPTCQFLLALFLFHEPFSRTHLHTFLLIWSGLALFTLNSTLQVKRNRID
ncbi:MAG: EamA family transporter RarD [Gammaproteobacteria bacterium]|nr:EamA family transporter RarD [Gammaproteobacteria bacterium]